MFRGFSEVSEGCETQKSAPVDSAFFNFGDYTDIIDKSAGLHLAPSTPKAKELPTLIEDGNLFSKKAATTVNSESLNEQLEDLTAAPRKIATLVTLKLMPENTCSRCKNVAKVEEESKGSSKTGFYCDCGMRGVMRRLRKEILSDLNVSKLVESREWKDRQLLEEELVEWFQKTLGGSDELSNFADEDRPHLMGMTSFLLALSCELPN